MNGAETVIKFLEDHQVDTCFGYPGGPILVLYDAIYRRNFPHILTRHEQGAIHAAEGYARVSGRPGVVIATSGPGATNLVTGLADALLDSTPILAITGAVARREIGRDAFQEADITGITDPVTKYNYLVMDQASLRPILEEAWKLTTAGRPGPVLVNIPKDLLSAEIPESHESFNSYPRLRPKPLKSELQIDKVVQALAAAKKPLLMLGGGCVISDPAPAQINTFVSHTAMPTCLTLMGIGAISPHAPGYLGMAGMHGSVQANKALGNCDLLLAVGCRFSDRAIANPERYSAGRTIIHVDIDPAEIGKNVKPDIEIEDDAGDFFHCLNQAMPAEFNADWQAWQTYLQDLTQAYEKAAAPFLSITDPLMPEYVLKRISDLLHQYNPIVVTDVGQHQMWAAQYFDIETPRSFLTSGGLGCMGFGLPAAIGAAKAAPGRLTIAVVGDGGMQMTEQELGTLYDLQLPVIIVILDNQTLGMVRQWQELFYDEHYSQSMLNTNPDFVKLADAYRIPGTDVHTAAELDQAVEQ
ncbi:MAG: biosynthetic-type acetolactate synthase large subunit, partial [Oscillospiraceae bacterium]|nr:biosynthetic-type acetolactate synthase large subunit [Oscillospiraceae bacterium]